MTSETEICNRALSAIGTRSTIASLAEDSNEARQCNLLYTPTRDEVLQMAHWNFARKTANLSLLKQAPGTPGFSGVVSNVWSSAYPAPPWLYEYAYPSDCVQMRYLQPQIASGWTGIVPIFGEAVTAGPSWSMPAVPWAAANDTDSGGNDINVILTSQYQAIGTYTRRITNTNLFGASFVQALVGVMAARLAISLTGDRGLANLQIELANRFITEARASDGNEGLTVQDTPADWISAREGWPIGAGGWFIAPYPPLFAGY